MPGGSQQRIPEPALVIDSPEGSHIYRLLACLGRLSLEMRGLKFRKAGGKTTLQIVSEIAGQNFGKREKAIAWINDEVKRLSEKHKNG